MYRSLLAGKRMLILLDNAVDATQIHHLLPGEPLCTVVVTSRRFLLGLVTRYNARHVKLGVLTEADSRDLLSLRLGSDRVAAEPAAVERLLGYCEGFALALDIVAGRAQRDPDVPLEELADELEEDATHFDDIEGHSTRGGAPAEGVCAGQLAFSLLLTRSCG